MSKKSKYKLDVNELLYSDDIGYDSKISILEGCIKQEQKNMEIARYTNVAAAGFTGSMTYFAVKSFIEGQVIAGIVQTALVGVSIATSVLGHVLGNKASSRKDEFENSKQYLQRKKEEVEKE